MTTKLESRTTTPRSPSYIASLGIVGNSMVIFVIARSVTMRKTYTNMLIVNRSGIDLMASILILITTMIKDYDDDLTGIMGELYCRFWLSDFPPWSLLLSSSYSLMAITFERYVSIVHPILHHSKCSSTKDLMLAGASWCSGFVCYRTVLRRATCRGSQRTMFTRQQLC